jgi:hypothetical protein
MATTRPFHEARGHAMIVRSCRTFVSRHHRPVHKPSIPMFRFRFLAGDAVAAVLTYSSSSSTALLSYQPGAKVPARSKVGYGLTRSLRDTSL